MRKIPKFPSQIQAAKGLAYFVSYCDGALSYVLQWEDADHETQSFDFEIPISDSGGGSFLPVMKGLNVLRWVRKHSSMLQEALLHANESESTSNDEHIVVGED
jgi:hypothetical protein